MNDVIERLCPGCAIQIMLMNYKVRSWRSPLTAPTLKNFELIDGRRVRTKAGRVARNA